MLGLSPEAAKISIHALREEGDRRLGAAAQVGEGISIHALREEGDLVPPPVVNDPAEFLSTPSARRATAAGCTR